MARREKQLKLELFPKKPLNDEVAELTLDEVLPDWMTGQLGRKRLAAFRFASKTINSLDRAYRKDLGLPRKDKGDESILATVGWYTSKSESELLDMRGINPVQIFNMAVLLLEREEEGG